MRNFVGLLFCMFLLSCQDDVGKIELPDNIRLPSQEELDVYGPKLLETKVFDGNIYLDGNDISNASYFSSIEEINGSLTLGDWGFKNAFPNLQIVHGNPLTGDGMFVNAATDSICFPSLREVRTSLSFSNSTELVYISLPSLQVVTGTLLILNNTKLESIANLNFFDNVWEIFIQSNPNLISITGASKLKEVQNDFIIEPYKLNRLEGSFSNLKVVGNRVRFIVEGNEWDLSWLEQLEECQLVSLIGDIPIEESCFLKKFATNNPSSIYIFDHSQGIFYSDWLVDNCP